MTHLVSLFIARGRQFEELSDNVTFNSQTGTYDIGKLDTNKFHILQKFLPKKKKYNFNEYEIRWNGATHILLKGGVVDAEATAAYNDAVAKGELPKVSNQATESAEEINAVVNALKKGQDPITGQEISKAQSFGITIGLVYMYVGGKYKGRKIKLPKSALENLEKQQAFKDKEVGGADIPKPNVGIVQSRVNLAENPTRFSPSKNAGMKHVRNRHYNPSKNAGQFTIPESDLKNILQSKQVVKTPVKQIESGDFERVIDIGKNMGTVKPSLGGQTTTWIKVITDKAGNIITTYPVPKP
ncbi:hypothetical protein [Listeria cossartiae]|uniref:hypothetical protein n=1 Tax=Listeria cossartiae TaxID=2838249 RepID=UPI00162854FB|nr:hypothetical protein [Listeria cossartiae]